jgi:hypothetical protein
MYGFPGVPLVQPGRGTAVPLELPKDVLRIGEQCIWSTQRLAVGAIANSTNRLFTTPLGQQGQGFAAGLSIAETNLKEGGRIPSGLAFDVLGITCDVHPGDVAANAVVADSLVNLQSIMRHGVLSWDFLQTIIDIAPVALVGAGGGVFGVPAGAPGAADVAAYANGNGGVFVYRKYPVALPANSTFNVILRLGSNAPAINGVVMDAKVSLIGQFKTAIEVG